MGCKEAPAIELHREVTQKERGGWKVSLMSSKWFVLLLLILAGFVWYGFYTTHTKGIIGSDDREYVSIARNIAVGRGIVKNFMYPIDFNFFEKVPVPEFFRPPGYPLIIAGFTPVICFLFFPDPPFFPFCQKISRHQISNGGYSNFDI
jgi:hypothetical protein